MLGQRVITTNTTSIPEVTLDKAEYVDDYLNPEAWIDVMKRSVRNTDLYDEEFGIYDRRVVADIYLQYLNEAVGAIR